MKSTDHRLREAERRFLSNPSDSNYRAYARASLAAGVPVVSFGISEGGSVSGPRDEDGSCLWINVQVSGRVLPDRLLPDEWVMARIAQMPRSLRSTANSLVEHLSEDEESLLDRWGDKPELRDQLRLSGPDYLNRVTRGAEAGAHLPEVYTGGGYGIWHTGGGCTAWALEEGPRHVMITGDSCVPDEHDEYLMLGFYLDEEDLGYAYFPNTLAGAQAAVLTGRRFVRTGETPEDME